MAHDKSADQLRATQVNGPQPLSVWKHNASGYVYRVLCCGIIEATLHPCVVYGRAGVTWVRPTAEFLERFTLVEE